MGRTLFLIAFIGVFSVNMLFSQGESYRFAHITTKEGLSNNQIQAIFKDSKGFIWIGTLSGLNRYDGYSFKIFKKEPFDTTSLIDNSVNAIYEDYNGNILVQTPGGFCIYNPDLENFSRNTIYTIDTIVLSLSEISSLYTDKSKNSWFITNTRGLIKYNTETKVAKSFNYSASDSSTISRSPVSDIAQDSKNNFWIMHYNGLLEKMDGNNFKITYRTWFLNKKFGQLNYFFRIFCDKDDALWIYTNATSMDLVHFNPMDKSALYISTEGSRFKTNSNLITSIIQDEQGKIWVGTDHGGINIIDFEKKSISYITNKRDDDKTLSQNSVICMYKDNNGIIWIGTYKQGLNYYHERMFVFKNYTNIPSDPNSLQYNDVNCFSEDEKGNILIGTNGGGINYFDRKQDKFYSLKHNPENKNSLSNDVVVSMFRDSKNDIWVGTYYGGLNRFDGKNFYHYMHDTANQRSISDNRIWEIYEDSRKNLWIGTLQGGLDLYDRAHEVFLHYSGSDPSTVRSFFIFAIKEDYLGNLWVGSSNGIFIIEWNTGKIINYSHSEQDYNTISSNLVVCFLEDSRKNMWVGTRDGLNLFDRKTNSFTKLRTEDGLPDNTIQGMLEDDLGHLWISTTKGISMMTIKTDSKTSTPDYNFVNYDESNGLQGHSFNDGAFFKTSKGELLFGGANGFNMFNPQEVSHVDLNPPVYIINFELLGKPLKVNDKNNKRNILSKSIINTRQIVLKHKENVFSLEFAALSVIDAERIKYRYKLEGFNDNWLYADYSDRKVTFTNLDPGKYTFTVQAFQNEDELFTNQAQLEIIVKPPLSRTMAAFVVYFLGLLGLMLLFRQLLLIKAHLKFQNQQAVLETQRQLELNIIKTRFFTNVSHEFRAPLTLILTPLERIMNKTDNLDIQPTLKLVYQNAKRLLSLVNQLLDFRKMEEQRLSVSLDYGNIVKFANEVYKSFSDLAESKKIKFTYWPTPEQLFMRFDEDKLEKILFNLLSNAFKFTHDSGEISIVLNLIEKDSPLNPLDGNHDTVEIKVSDTGIGIPSDKHELVFERFFQSEQPSSILNKGSGIGLSLTKEFVKLHNGKIILLSEPDKGSTFSVYLPVNRESLESGFKDLQDDSFATVNHDFDESEIPLNRHDVTILLVEDNEDFRFYLRDNLKIHYNICEARNGKEAWDIILSEMPDLIVSDLLMPEMTGLELCAKVKNNTKTSHIPFFLLTASHTEEFKVEGYKLGADAYLTKPFSFEILESSIRNLIVQRERTRKSYQENFKIEPGTIGITSLDEKLMNKALKIVEDNLTDTDFSVERLSQELGFSRGHLYKKMLSITGKSPVEFIRLIRLKRASQLLKESQLTVSEIAYQVGFNDPRYFSKQFKAEFNMLPSKYKTKHFTTTKRLI